MKLIKVVCKNSINKKLKSKKCFYYTILPKILINTEIL